MAKKACLLLSLICYMTTSSCEEQGDSTNLEYKVLTPNTWLSGFNDCNDLHNLTMASAEDVRDRNEGYNFTSEISKFLPVWTYAFEVTLSSGTTHLIVSNDVSIHFNSFRCLANNGSIFTQCCQSLTNARTLCKKHQSSLDLVELHPQDIGFYAARIFIDTTIWVNLRNETEFLQENAQWSVRCLLLDETGNLRTDNCNEHHRTLCIRADTQPILQNVAQRRIPQYTESTTGPPITYSSNNTKSTTVNISTDTGPDTSERSKTTAQTTYVTKSVSSLVNTTRRSSFSTSMLPNTNDRGFSVTVSVPIAVSSVVVVAIVVCVAIVVLTKRRRKHRGAHQTRVEYVSEQTNYITAISDEAGDRANATVQDNDTSGVNDGYENPNPQRNVYEALRESRVEEHGYGTSGQAAGGFYQSLEGERMDVHNYEVADQSRELPYDSLEDTTKRYTQLRNI